MTSIDLSTHPVTPTSFGRWQPLNAPLGVTAFGISAVVCDPDEPFTIDHDEVETGQQEVYIVVAGRAQFTIGEETVEAGPGEIVAIADPAVTRGFIALDPVTRIVCVGAALDGKEQAYGEWITDAAVGDDIPGH
jgi:hypothetical protein